MCGNTKIMKTIPARIQTFLQEPYSISPEQLDYYEKNRFIKLKEVLNEECITYFNALISLKVNEMNQEERPLNDRDTYGKAFLQLFNLWQEDDQIKELIFSKRLAKIASDLMQTTGARLYHDQALFKEPGGGITPWHADQYYWPLQTDKTITAWIPLQATPFEMGPLEFSAGSHRIVEGRDLGISDKSEAIIQQKLRISDFEHVIEPYDLGEVSFHSGWIFHRAGANLSAHMRKVMTVIYMDEQMKLKAPENESQRNDWIKWCPGAEIDQVIDGPLNPLLYSKNRLTLLQS